MKPIATAVLLVALLAPLGCYRTVYTNLSNPALVGSETVPIEKQPRWRHFFLYGWAPGKRTVDARAACGGTHLIDEIQTRKTFLQGVVTALSSYYVVIYTPWTGRVVCK